MANPTLKTSRKPARIDLGVVTLFSRPSDASWIVDIDGEAWLVETGKSGLVLCGYCKVRVDSKGYDDRRDTCRGFLRVLSEAPNETCILGFSNWSGEPLNRFVELKAQYRTASSVKWISGRHNDQWIDVDAVLRVEGASSIEIKAYLPAGHDRMDTKTVDVFCNGDRITSAELRRGEPLRIVVPTQMATQDSVELLIESEYAEDLQGSSDERLLGCVVTDVKLTAEKAPAAPS